MAKYDLTGSLEKSFNFNIGTLEYSFRKPTVREMREISKAFQGVDDDANPEVQLEQSEKGLDALYSLVTPVGHSTPIRETLDNSTVDVQIAFNEMVQKELGAKQ